MRKTILRVMYSVVLAAIICIGCGGDDGGQTNSLKVGDLLNAITGGGTDTPTTPTTYTLTINVSSMESGTVSRSPDADSYEAGTRVTVTATPKAGYEFIGWSGVSSSEEPTVTITMNGDKALYAGFGRIGANLPKYNVYFNQNGAIGTPPETIQRDSGSVVLLPDQAGMTKEWYSFAGWNTEANGTGISYNISDKYTVIQTATLFAKWTRNTYTLSINAVIGGTTSPNHGPTKYNAGTDVAVTATAAQGYTFIGWSGAASGTANPVTVVMDDNKVLTANFQPIVTVSSVGTGASGNGNYAVGAKVTISAGTAPPDYRFKNWTTSSGVTFDNANSSMTAFTMPPNPVTVTANFEAVFITDSRNGQKYKTVRIGDQNWMAENLNYAVDSSWCYAGSSDSCAKYGRLYQWSSSMGIEAKYNNEKWNGSDVKRKGVCPSGWHLPSRSEWGTLVTTAGGSSVAGKKLKSTTGWNIYSGIINTDEFSFSALPGGGRSNFNGSFGDAGDYGDWWTATEFDAGNAYPRNMNYLIDGVNEYYNFKSHGWSVRCLEDE